jgi:hypothetical protein
MSAVTSSFNIDEFGALSREQLVYLARTAEASERFEGAWTNCELVDCFLLSRLSKKLFVSTSVGSVWARSLRFVTLYCISVCFAVS